MHSIGAPLQNAPLTSLYAVLETSGSSPEVADIKSSMFLAFS